MEYVDKKLTIELKNVPVDNFEIWSMVAYEYLRKHDIIDPNISYEDSMEDDETYDLIESTTGDITAIYSFNDDSQIARQLLKKYSKKLGIRNLNWQEFIDQETDLLPCAIYMFNTIYFPIEGSFDHELDAPMQFV